MLEFFDIHNQHQESLTLFKAQDPHLKRLRQFHYIYTFPEIKLLPFLTPGIYTLSGNRQIGKTTLLKQWMLFLLEEKNVHCNNIFFLTGEMIDNNHKLVNLISQILTKKYNDELTYLILDETTYVSNWDKGIKFLSDSGALDNVILILSGSDKIIMQDALKRFPGRRGSNDVIDYHLHPLSFKEVVNLKDKYRQTKASNLDNDFEEYLIHGGFLRALNDFHINKSISTATYTTYFQWILGDLLKQGKQEVYLQEICRGILKHYGSQITWNSLAKELSIEHHKTVADYISILESMDAVFIQHAICENNLRAAPKKAKKIYFTDPFIFHAINFWISAQDSLATLKNSKLTGKLVESVVVTHYRRYFKTFYIKGTSGEVDIAFIDKKTFWPVEIKWTNQIQQADLKQIKKYKNSLLLTKNKNCNFDDLPSEYIPTFLANFQVQR